MNSFTGKIPKRIGVRIRKLFNLPLMIQSAILMIVN